MHDTKANLTGSQMIFDEDGKTNKKEKIVFSTKSFKKLVYSLGKTEIGSFFYIIHKNQLKRFIDFKVSPEEKTGYYIGYINNFLALKPNAPPTK